METVQKSVKVEIRDSRYIVRIYSSCKRFVLDCFASVGRYVYFNLLTYFKFFLFHLTAMQSGGKVDA